MIRWLAMLGLCLGLAACSGGTADSPSASRTTYKLIFDRIGARLNGTGGPAPFGITRAVIADYPDPLIVATIPGGARAGLVFAGQNGPWRSWQTLDGTGFTTRAGVLTATRGFGDDLLSAELSTVVDRVTARSPGAARRVERRLDGDNKIIVTHYSCAIEDKGPENIVVFEVSHATRRMVERCQPETRDSPAKTLENTYWVGTRGTVWRSDQRVGPAAGRVILEQLIE